MKYTYAKEGRVTKTVHRDAHEPSTLYFETQTDEKDVIDLNTKIRDTQLLKRGQRNPLVDGDELTASFQFPTLTDYHLCRKKYPDLFAELDLGGSHSVHAGEKLSLLLPQYVTMVKRGDRL